MRKTVCTICTCVLTWTAALLCPETLALPVVVRDSSLPGYGFKASGTDLDDLALEADYVPIAFKTTLDALNGLMKCDGAGNYSAITDNSANWNTAYGWGNHAGLYVLIANKWQWDGGSTNLVAATGRTSLGLGTMATQAASAVAITGGTAAGLTGLAVRDSSAAYDVTLAANSSTALTFGRTLSFDLVNQSRALKLAGDATISQDYSTTGSPQFANLKLTGGGGIYPSADSTTALYINKADNATHIVTINSTSGFVGINCTPQIYGTHPGTATAQIYGNLQVGGGVGTGVNDNGLIALSAWNFLSGDNFYGQGMFGMNLAVKHVGASDVVYTPKTHGSLGYKGLYFDNATNLIKFYNTTGATTAGATVTPTTLMSLNASGNLGIGTVGQLSKLAINGGLHVGGDSDAGDNNIVADGTITGTTLNGTTGINTGAGAGTERIDAAGVFTATQVNVDNLRLDANTLSSTNTNGDINASPNGTGRVVLNGVVLQYVSATNDDPTVDQRLYRLATTNATPATIADIGASTDKTTAIEATIWSRSTNAPADQGAFYILRAVYAYPFGGSVTQIGSDSLTVVAESTAGWTASTTTDGISIQVQVTGAAGSNITWHCQAKIMSVGS